MRGLFLIPMLLALAGGAIGAACLAGADDCAQTCPLDAGNDPCSPLCEDCPSCLACHGFVSEEPVAPAGMRPAHAVAVPPQEPCSSAYTGEILHVPKPTSFAA